MRVRLTYALCCLLSIGIVSVVSQPMLGQAMGGGGSQKVLSPPAKAEVNLDGTEITIDYGAPSMRGRAIYGGLVPYGKVWRTGANPATTFKTSGPLQIGDLSVPAGSYTLYTLPMADGWKLIINKQTKQWGTEYHQDQDLGRTTMMVAGMPVVLETMKIDFEKTAGPSTQLHIKWADKDVAVPVKAGK
jgi:hypothetical protein